MALALGDISVSETPNLSPTVQQSVPTGFSEIDEQDVGGGGQSGGEGGGRQGAGGRGVPASRDDGQEEAQAALQVSAANEPFSFIRS